MRGLPAFLIATPLLVIGIAGCNWRSESFSPSSTGTQPLPTVCPICNTSIVPLSSVQDDPTHPSLNLTVWNRSSCANLLISPSTPFCPHCHFAYIPALNQWTRASDDPKSFLRPFTPAITEFPTPQAVSSRVVYEQTYASGNRIESIAFWFKDQPAYLATATQYATAHALTLNPDNMHPTLPGETYIRAESRNP